MAGPNYYRAQVTIPMDSGIPADAAVNVWSFRNTEAASDPATDAALIQGRLDGFYSAISGLYSSRCQLTGTRIKVYNFADPQPRVPILDDAVSVTADITTNMDFPPEVAMCLSFKGAAVSGVNARRRRGRVYLGPLQSSTTTDYHEVLAANITTVMSAADTHLAVAADPVQWCVYSPYTHHDVPVGVELDPDVHPEVPTRLVLAFTPVATYWMDNAWDTQRRRGTKATSRTTATA